MQKSPKSGSSVDVVKKIEEYYIYNDKGLVVQSGTSQGIKISAESIIKSDCSNCLIFKRFFEILRKFTPFDANSF